MHELVQIFTSEKSSWYPEPEHDIPLSALPSIPPLPDEKLSQKEIGQMRDYALTYGAAVRQRTNRQETTMARHGTMPKLIYQRQLEISTDKVDVCKERFSMNYLFGSNIIYSFQIFALTLFLVIHTEFA